MEKKKDYDTLETSHGTFQTTLNKKQSLRKPWVPNNPKQIKSAIPGTIVEIVVKEGDAVNMGDTLLIFKAMKMNNVIKAPMDGRVKEILVEVDENISSGTVMIELE